MSLDYIDGTEKIGDLIVQVFADTNPMSPREGDMLATLFCWHPRYELGDEQFSGPEDVGGSRSMAEIAEWLKRERNAINLIPLFLYDHSGITMSCGETIPDEKPATDEQTTVERGSFGERGLNGGYTWDTSMVGFAFTTRKQIELLGAPADDIDHQIRAEVEEYDDFLTGNVWAYRIVKPCDHADEHANDEQIADCPHSEVIDSCYNFIGDTKYAWEEARAAAQPVTA